MTHSMRRLAIGAILSAITACATATVLPGEDAGTDGAPPPPSDASKSDVAVEAGAKDGGSDAAIEAAVEASCVSDGSVQFTASGTGQTGTVQTWTVPNGVCKFTVDAFGAQGGSTKGGLGAEIRGDFTTPPGHVLDVVVGQQGITNACGSGTASGGGGGGSFVWDTADASMPMIAAGGGGGGNLNWSDPNCSKGIDAVVTVNGTQGNGSTSAQGGTNGQGGAGNAPSGTGSGGAGWLSGGQASTFGTGCTGGQCPTDTSPFMGGNGSTTYGPGGQGGYGGGGGAVCGCGGGGGYSGGGAGEGSTCRAGGGGGGSYNAGTNPVSTAGVQSGDGKVVITW